jgi:hypothetical protein
MGLDTFENAIADTAGFGTAARRAPEAPTGTEVQNICDWCLRPVKTLHVTPETWSNLACHECYTERFDADGNDKLAARISELKAEIDRLEAEQRDEWPEATAVRLETLIGELNDAERRF